MNITDIKKETQLAYNKYASEYGERTKYFLKKYLAEDVNLFLRNLKGKKILDLGSGPGRDALFFKQNGFSPVCADMSESMVNLCRQKGLKAYEMDIENLEFENNSFDGIWSYASLLHLPKNKIEGVLEKIKELIKENGIFYIGMKVGEFEGFKTDQNYPDYRRYFSFYQKEELEKLLIKSFEILHFSRVEIDSNHRYVNFLCKKL